MDLVTALAFCTLAAGTAWHAPQFDHACGVTTLPRAETQETDRAPSSEPQAADTRDAAFELARWQPLIAEAARRFDLPEDWIRAVMRAESGGRSMLDGHPVTSRAGAMGLMQVMPNTYDAMRRRYGLGADPFDPRDSTLAGAAYLREMRDRYGYPGVFAAYNAGPQRFDQYLLHGVQLPDETWRYLAVISPAAAASVRAASPFPDTATTQALLFPSGTALFFKIGPGSITGFAPAQSMGRGLHSDTLFAPLGLHQGIAPNADERP